MAPLEELDDSTRRTRKLARGPVCCEIVRYLLQTLRVHIYTLALTRLLVDHDYNIYCLKLTSWRHVRPAPIINSSLFYIQATSSHIPECFHLPSVKQLFCRMMTYSRPHTPLPNALRKPLAEWCSSTKLGPQVSLFPVPIFGVNNKSKAVLD
jgi:hypothetical protein